MKKKKSNAGRPSKYKSEFCTSLIEYMSQGHSLTSWCSKNNLTKETAYQWAKSKPEFSDALDVARVKCQDHWEKMLHATAAGKIKGNVHAIIFWMKNRFINDWRDKIENEIQVKNIEPVVIKLGEETIEMNMKETKDDTPGNPNKYSH